jgi:hypothetical protein
MNNSKKPVKELSELLGNRRFLFPRTLANDCDPATGKPVVMVQINSKKTMMPVEEPVEVNEDAFCLLKDVGIIKEEYQLDEVFDPMNPLKKYGF